MLTKLFDVAVAVSEEGSALGLCPAETRIDPVRTEDFPSDARRPAYSVLDTTSTWRLLGAPARHWREGLCDTLRQMKEQDLG